MNCPYSTVDASHRFVPKVAMGQTSAELAADYRRG